MVKKKRNRILEGGLYNFLILLLGIVAVNLLSEQFYDRIDLTKEGRFTLSNTSRELAKELDDAVYFHIFLEGDFPSEYRRLKKATKDMLNEFRRLSGNEVEYKFEDMLSGKDVQEKEDILRQLSSKGLLVTQPEMDVDEIAGEKYIIPGGLVFYKGKEYPINLLKQEYGKSPEEIINGSIELLEYEIANVLRKCISGKTAMIGFAEGHGELGVMEIADVVRSLEEYYTVHRVNLNLLDTATTRPFWDEIARDTANSGAILFNGLLSGMLEYDAIVVAKPTIEFMEEELLLLDQYVMNGGKLVWLVDPMVAEMDSLDANSGTFVAFDRQINLDDMLFRYGVRLNPDLIEDLNCHGIPVINRRGGSRPGFQPWIFYPLAAMDSEHPIVRNLDNMWLRFASSIDTLGRGNKKTVLLHTGENSRTMPNPVRVSLNLLAERPAPELFRQKNIPMGVLLEGKFTSPFAKRRAVKRNAPVQLKDTINDNAMIVIADGDFVRNQVNPERGQIYPLGYDRYASQAFGQPIQFANKNFFINCIDYLCDKSRLIDVRSKKVELRLLDKVKVKKERLKWQLVNMVLPVVLILVFGIANGVYRRRKYVR